MFVSILSFLLIFPFILKFPLRYFEIKERYKYIGFFYFISFIFISKYIFGIYFIPIFLFVLIVMVIQSYIQINKKYGQYVFVYMGRYILRNMYRQYIYLYIVLIIIGWIQQFLSVIRYDV